MLVHAVQNQVNNAVCMCLFQFFAGPHISHDLNIRGAAFQTSGDRAADQTESDETGGKMINRCIHSNYALFHK